MVDCSVIDNGVYVHTNGTIRPCCKFRHNEFGYIDEVETVDFSVLKTVEWPKGCVSCRLDEEQNIPSKRQQYNKNFSSKDYFLDVSLGNYCNLKCRMCNEELSTSWYADAKKLGRNIPKAFELNKSQVDMLFTNIDKSKKLTVELKGGEPFMNRNAEYIFSKLYEYNARIRLITNGTLLPEWFLEMLPNLDIDFVVSVDGVKNTYQYVRGDNTFSWNECLKNIEKISSIIPKLRFNYVVQNLTIKDMIDFENLDFGNITWIILRTPKYLACNIMPEESKPTIVEDLHNLKSCPNGLIDYFMQPCDKTLYETFIEYSAKLDTYRKQSLIDTLPHLISAEGKEIYDRI